MKMDSDRLSFGDFEVDLATHQLRRAGFLVPLQEQPFRVLEMLLRNPGKLVTRQEIQDALWSDVLVDVEVGLNNAVKKVRDALRDSAEKPRFIETHKGKGYRFIADVQELPAPASIPQIPEETPIPLERTPTVRPRWLVAGALTVVVLGILAFWSNQQNSGVSASESRRVLIMPLTVHGQTDRAEHLGRVFAEALAINLSPSASLLLLPIPSATAHTSEDALAYAHTLSLPPDFILYGSISREGLEAIVTLTMLEPKSGAVVWGMQDTVVGAGDLARSSLETATNLRSQLGVMRPELHEYFRDIWASEQMAQWQPLDSTLAALKNHDIDTGLRLTQQLIQDYPSEIQAARMRLVAVVDAVNSRIASFDDLSTAIDQLLAVDPASPSAAVLQGWVARDSDNNAKKALSLTTQTLARKDLTPSCRAHALREHSMNLIGSGSLQSAANSIEEAIRLDPANSWNYAYRARVLHRLEQDDLAVTCFRQAVAMDRYHTEELARFLERIERWDEALETHDWLCSNRHTMLACTGYAWLLQDRDQHEQAREVAISASTLPPTLWGSYNLACYWALAGESQQALHFLEIALDLGLDRSRLQSDSDLNSLHGLPAFEALLVEPDLP